MGDLILKMSMSLDGFVSDLGGTSTWRQGRGALARAAGEARLGRIGLDEWIRRSQTGA